MFDFPVSVFLGFCLRGSDEPYCIKLLDISIEHDRGMLLAHSLDLDPGSFVEAPVGARSAVPIISRMQPAS